MDQTEQALVEDTSQATDTGRGTSENGYAIGEAAWEKPWRVSADDVANGYSIAFSKRFGANLATASWTTNASQVGYVDGEENGCAHPTTQVGAALPASCNALVANVCFSDPYCCAGYGSWDARCVGEANDFADDFTGTHSVAQTGTALPDSHSACAATVNALDAYCRTASWDALCVNAAYELCYARYVTRPRIESGRFVADACVEPIGTGAPAACPVPRSGPSGTECCRRSLVLDGVYTEKQSSLGDYVEWRNWASTTTPLAQVTVRTTLVPDPCTGPIVNSARSCGAVHPLWQLAGTNKPLYPDCPNVATTATYNCSPVDTQHANANVRTVLVNAGAALSNSVGSYAVDLRYVERSNGVIVDSAAVGRLPPDASFDPSHTEGVWDALDTTSYAGQRTITGRIRCDGNGRLESSATTVTDCPSFSGALSTAAIRSLWH